MSVSLMQEIEKITTTALQRRFLIAHWEGGGNTPPVMAVTRRLLARGHVVRIISDPANRREVIETGAEFAAWSRVPSRADKSPDSDILRDWECKSPPELLGRLRDRVFVGPSLGHAQDVIDEIDRFQADVVLTSEMLLGAMVAAERMAVPCVALATNICILPLPGVPAFGPGFLPARGPLGRLRDRFIQGMAMREFGKGAEAFNATRNALGLPSLVHPFDQFKRLNRFLILTSAAFDFPAKALPENLIYTGPELDDPAWAEPWLSPFAPDDQRPLVLVGFSTTFQDQIASLRRVIEALSRMEVRAVVTVGPSLQLPEFPKHPNVHLCISAPHSQILQAADVMVTHAGHGSVIRSLAAGVPLVCMPMGRDQNDNAARVFARGAGLRLKPTASVREITTAIRTLLASPEYRRNAEDLGRRIRQDAEESSTIRILEDVAQRAVTR